MRDLGPEILLLGVLWVLVALVLMIVELMI
jgi:hypothetical protein